MPVRALRPNAGRVHPSTGVRQNPINARKGIETDDLHHFAQAEPGGQNPINARKGIETVSLVQIYLTLRAPSESY